MRRVLPVLSAGLEALLAYRLLPVNHIPAPWRGSTQYVLFGLRGSRAACTMLQSRTLRAGQLEELCNTLANSLQIYSGACHARREARMGNTSARDAHLPT